MTADKGSEFVRVRRDALQRARDTAMEWTVRGRIPECGEFGGIAQDLDAMLSAAPPAESHPQGVEAVAWVYDFYGPQFTDNPDTAELARQEGCNVRPLIYAHPPAAQIAAPDHIADARKMVAAPGDTWPATEADEAAMAQAADAGNPAWWRGHDEACTILCQKVHAILDGRDSGRGVANEPWESTRRRLLAAALRSQGRADAVDEAMIERAWSAYCDKAEDIATHVSKIQYANRECLRAALTAALAQQANQEQPPNA